MLEEWSFLGIKCDAMGTVSNLVTARKRQTEHKTNLFTESSRCKDELIFEGHAHCKVLF